MHVFVLPCLKAQKHARFHVLSPFSASFYPIMVKGLYTNDTILLYIMLTPAL